MIDGFCATDKRSAITARHACRPKRSREAAKRPGYVVLALPAPEPTAGLLGWFGPLLLSLAAFGQTARNQLQDC
jgi:hypothetical protein